MILLLQYYYIIILLYYIFYYIRPHFFHPFFSFFSFFSPSSLLLLFFFSSSFPLLLLFFFSQITPQLLPIFHVLIFNTYFHNILTGFYPYFRSFSPFSLISHVFPRKPFVFAPKTAIFRATCLTRNSRTTALINLKLGPRPYLVLLYLYPKDQDQIITPSRVTRFYRVCTQTPAFWQYFTFFLCAIALCIMKPCNIVDAPPKLVCIPLYPLYPAFYSIQRRFIPLKWYSTLLAYHISGNIFRIPLIVRVKIVSFHTLSVAEISQVLLV